MKANDGDMSFLVGPWESSTRGRITVSTSGEVCDDGGALISTIEFCGGQWTFGAGSSWFLTNDADVLVWSDKLTRNTVSWAPVKEDSHKESVDDGPSQVDHHSGTPDTVESSSAPELSSPLSERALKETQNLPERSRQQAPASTGSGGCGIVSGIKRLPPRAVAHDQVNKSAVGRDQGKKRSAAAAAAELYEVPSETTTAPRSLSDEANSVLTQAYAAADEPFPVLHASSNGEHLPLGGHAHSNGEPFPAHARANERFPAPHTSTNGRFSAQGRTNERLPAPHTSTNDDVSSHKSVHSPSSSRSSVSVSKKPRPAVEAEKQEYVSFKPKPRGAISSLRMRLKSRRNKAPANVVEVPTDSIAGDRTPTLSTYHPQDLYFPEDAPATSHSRSRRVSNSTSTTPGAGAAAFSYSHSRRLSTASGGTPCSFSETGSLTSDEASVSASASAHPPPPPHPPLPVVLPDDQSSGSGSGGSASRRKKWTLGLRRSRAADKQRAISQRAAENFMTLSPPTGYSSKSGSLSLRTDTVNPQTYDLSTENLEKHSKFSPPLCVPMPRSSPPSNSSSRRAAPTKRRKATDFYRDMGFDELVAYAARRDVILDRTTEEREHFRAETQRLTKKLLREEDGGSGAANASSVNGAAANDSASGDAVAIASVSRPSPTSVNVTADANVSSVNGAAANAPSVNGSADANASSSTASSGHESDGSEASSFVSKPVGGEEESTLVEVKRLLRVEHTKRLREEKSHSDKLERMSEDFHRAKLEWEKQEAELQNEISRLGSEARSLRARLDEQRNNGTRSSSTGNAPTRDHVRQIRDALERRSEQLQQQPDRTPASRLVAELFRECSSLLKDNRAKREQSPRDLSPPPRDLSLLASCEERLRGLITDGLESVAAAAASKAVGSGSWQAGSASARRGGVGAWRQASTRSMTPPLSPSRSRSALSPKGTPEACSPQSSASTRVDLNAAPMADFSLTSLALMRSRPNSVSERRSLEDELSRLKSAHVRELERLEADHSIEKGALSAEISQLHEELADVCRKASDELVGARAERDRLARQLQDAHNSSAGSSPRASKSFGDYPAKLANAEREVADLLEEREEAMKTIKTLQESLSHERLFSEDYTARLQELTRVEGDLATVSAHSETVLATVAALRETLKNSALARLVNSTPDLSARERLDLSNRCMRNLLGDLTRVTESLPSTAEISDATLRSQQAELHALLLDLLRDNVQTALAGNSMLEHEVADTFDSGDLSDASSTLSIASDHPRTRGRARRVKKLKKKKAPFMQGRSAKLPQRSQTQIFDTHGTNGGMHMIPSANASATATSSMPRQRPKRSRLGSLAVRATSASQRKRDAAEAAERERAHEAERDLRQAEIHHLRVTLESLHRDYEAKESQCRQLEKDVEVLNRRNIDLTY